MDDKVKEIVEQFQSRETEKEINAAMRVPVDLLHEYCKKDIVDKLSGFINLRLSREGYLPVKVKQLFSKPFDWGYQEGFGVKVEGIKDPEASAIGKVGQYYEQLYYSFEEENKRLLKTLAKIARCRSFERAKKLAREEL